MTVSLEVVSEAVCRQMFTERYDEFTFGNDTVTAFDPDWDTSKGPHSKAWPAGQVKACW